MYGTCVEGLNKNRVLLHGKPLNSQCWDRIWRQDIKLWFNFFFFFLNTSPLSARLKHPSAFVASHLWPGFGGRQTVDCWRIIVLIQIILSVNWVLKKSLLFPLKQLITACDKILHLEAPLLRNYLSIPVFPPVRKKTQSSPTVYADSEIVTFWQIMVPPNCSL